MSIYEYLRGETHEGRSGKSTMRWGFRMAFIRDWRKAFIQGRYEAFLEMGLSEEEARRRAQAGNENGKDNVGVQRDNTVEK